MKLIQKFAIHLTSLIAKEIAIIADGKSICAALTDERGSYNKMIEYVTIRKLKSGVLII